MLFLPHEVPVPFLGMKHDEAKEWQATDVIVKEWPNIQRIVASLAQKDVTQPTIVRKLSFWLSPLTVEFSSC